jgi:DNA gyrase/topoisomerase IV subunit B
MVSTFYYPKGTKEFFSTHIGKEKHTEIFQKELLASGRDRYNYSEYTAFARISLCFAKKVSFPVWCIHNFSNLPCGGTHLDAIQTNITNYFNWYFLDELGGKYTFEDIAKFMTIVVETRC